MLEVDVEESPESMVFTGRNRSSEETPAIEMELVDVDFDMIFRKALHKEDFPLEGIYSIAPQNGLVTIDNGNTNVLTFIYLFIYIFWL